MAIIGGKEKVKDPQRRKGSAESKELKSKWQFTSSSRRAFYLATFFQYNKRLLRQKTGGACLYMPQDGH